MREYNVKLKRMSLESCEMIWWEEKLSNSQRATIFFTALPLGAVAMMV